MHDAGYVVVGYALTLLMVGGYRWRLAARSQRARALITSLGSREPATARRRRP